MRMLSPSKSSPTMPHESTSQRRTFTNPLAGVTLGDPFVLRHRGEFYLYGTNDGAPLSDGRVVPVFRSSNLIDWEPLGGALVPHEPTAEHWAPEVLAWNGRFYMVVSFGDVVKHGHALWVAVADHPAGPFELRSRISGQEERFSIDGAWLLDDDGKLYLFRCVDFIKEDDPPHGTGIVVQPMRDPLTPAGPASTVLRASAPWHLFERERTMPLYEGRRFAEWTTIEGPAPVRRGGRYYCGYSGGNYTGAYGTGEAVAQVAARTLPRFARPGRSDFQHCSRPHRGTRALLGRAARPDPRLDRLAWSITARGRQARLALPCLVGHGGGCDRRIVRSTPARAFLAHRTDFLRRCRCNGDAWVVDREREIGGQNRVDYGMSRRKQALSGGTV